jgi:curved DNA-binding protein CbpA
MRSSKGFLDEKITRRFYERIAESLAREPLDLQPGAHRERLKALIGGLGEMNFYQLLEVSPGCSEDEIHRAYSALARVVHPVHAKPLGMTSSLGALELLFERVTEAYLTLNDPDRSQVYQMATGTRIGKGAEPTPEARRKEQVEQAGRFFRVSRGLMNESRYHDAVQTLQQAVKLDPRAEYYALLAEALAHNPNWLKDAARAYHSAVELSPHDPELRTALALVLERAGAGSRAEEQYNAALALDPEHADAQSGVARLQAQRREVVVEKPLGVRIKEFLRKALAPRNSG